MISDPFHNPSDIPVRLSYHLGFDATGECWYRASAPSNWIYTGGNTFYWDPDGDGAPPWTGEAVVPPCTSEPSPAPDPVAFVWEVAQEHIHETPLPVVNPDPVGLAGLETFVTVDPPPVFNEVLAPPVGPGLELDIRVGSVTVDWGDGSDDVFTESVYEELALPFPDGAARHVFESKTCPEPGGPRCHPTLSSYPLEMSYQWLVRWRVDGAALWNVLAVPDTTTAVAYDVDEVIGVLTG